MQCEAQPQLKEPACASAACSSRAVVIMYDTVEAQWVGRGRVPLAHREQRMQRETPPRLKEPACASAACSSRAVVIMYDTVEAQ
jgi:hypothetical protein